MLRQIARPRPLTNFRLPTFTTTAHSIDPVIFTTTPSYIQQCSIVRTGRKVMERLSASEVWSVHPASSESEFRPGDEAGSA